MRIPVEVPATVRVAFWCWLAAVGAGVIETILVVTGGGHQDGLVAGVAVRAVVFTAAVVVSWQMLTGRPWARIALTAGLGVIGLSSLVADPIAWLAEGNSVASLLADSTMSDLIFGAVRAVHVVAVLAATALMFTPPANAWFRPASAGDHPRLTSGKAHPARRAS
ncbi:hypothetical protein Ait01nite_055640 [Actinoplanes italicus]|uniref:Uncharacterized protein n=1 Tax=Actinoplanes italicus TaxID=113567 RepID=A0A2T0K837_9ACTN|nr:hypothetical protein [Actinoplanes italicus]PRX18904.1 hypothetical protein CLV67_11151 [Actinoplanes italicus]GIE32519.1 hypothetical protein Ait01nite_055640 [Actinoplanes italicus]